MDYIKIYARYCFSVSNNLDKAVEIKREIRDYLKSSYTFYENNSKSTLEYSFNSSQLILEISGDKENMNIITNINSQIKRYLKYDRNEVLLKDLSILQTEAFNQSHIYGLVNKLKTWRIGESFRKFTIFPLTKDGFLRVVSIKIRMRPNLSHGLRLLG